jgi:hypothetical protein
MSHECPFCKAGIPTKEMVSVPTADRRGYVIIPASQIEIISESVEKLRTMMKPSDTDIRQMRYHTVIPFVLDVASHKIQRGSESAVKILSLRWFKKWYMGFGF